MPIYPGVLINQLGGTIGVEPLKFGGTLGASIATLLELNLSFLYREATADELGFFGGQGKLSFQGDEIATLGADVYSDGYTDAQLKIDLHFPFDSRTGHRSRRRNRLLGRAVLRALGGEWQRSPQTVGHQRRSRRADQQPDAAGCLQRLRRRRPGLLPLLRRPHLWRPVRLKTAATN